MAEHIDSREPITSRRGFFWVGLERVTHPAGRTVRGPMYVEWEAPVEVRRPHPVVLIHGGGGQGTDYLGTPDGRPGWATFLVQEGYIVYVVDRPGHGRASYHPDLLGPMGPPFTFEFAHWLFMPPPEGPASHPTSHLHTQWPGTGPEDAVADQLLAGTGPMIADFAAAHALEQTRGAELLDRIGPAILVSHSAGGPVGWLMGDARPDLVKALVAIETMGPPFLVREEMGLSLDWGLTAAPLTYDPPAAEPSELARETHEVAAGPPVVLQAEPARRLPNLARFPIAVVTAEASPFIHFDGHTVEFLKQAGCDVERVRLADHGVHGNGHGMMMERNNREALQVILDWLDRRVPA
jgi:pimeloyl-ACP methyl ester carboxylesterase